MTDDFGIEFGESAETIQDQPASTDPCDLLVEISAFITQNHTGSLARFIRMAENRRSWLLYLVNHPYLVSILVQEEAGR